MRDTHLYNVHKVTKKFSAAKYNLHKVTDQLHKVHVGALVSAQHISMAEILESQLAIQLST